jgi:hypothetical protein
MAEMNFKIYWMIHLGIRVSVIVNLRLAVYHRTVRLGDKPLETNDQYFFPTGHLQS